MAESSSTGNSGTTSTSTSTGGNGNGGTTSTSTSTGGNGKGGAAPAGSQTSSNGSFSTGNGKGGNNGVGPGLSFGAGVGAINGPSIGLPSFNNGKSGFTGFASNNFGQGWGSTTHTVTPDSSGKHTVHPNANGKHTIYATTESDRNGSTVKQLTVPVMTVDEVYGKGNQSMVESQGDYAASSNEKSNVETSTFGKQDEISVTPVSVTKDEGLVNNDAIQSVEGLDFQQKDKANQEVMEAKKSRDEAEAEDNANSMRNQIKAVAEKDAEEDNNAFQVGEKNTFEEQNKAKINELNQQKQALEDAKNEEKDAIVAAEKAEEEAKKADKAVEEALSLENRFKQLVAKITEKKKECRLAKGDSLLGALEKAGKLVVSPFVYDPGIQLLEEETESLAQELGTDAADILGKNTIGDLLPGGKGEKLSLVQQRLDKIVADRVAVAKDNQQKAQETAKSAKAHATEVTTKVQEAQANYDKANQEYTTWKTEYWAGAKKAKAEEEAAAEEVETVTPEAPSYKSIIEAAKEEINNSKELTDEQKAEACAVVDNVESAAENMEKASSDLAANPNDANVVTTCLDASRTLNKALKDAKGNKVLANTNFNRTFAKSVVAAINNSKVTMPDGSTKSIAEFMTETVTRSPEIAKGLYEAKAKNYEENGHKVLAAIENAKAKMVMTWVGSKFTFADNQVRSQFNQIAKTNMSATYAAYSNVLNDETGKYSETEKAEALTAINQANALMTASAALKASTGFFSGIGDSMSDGVYGVTNPEDLNAYQETVNVVGNFARVALCLGITPGANEAYQNMYYLAGAKVNESGLFSKDFDGDGFALCQEYGNNAAAGMIASVGELATGIALTFNPATFKLGLNLTINSVKTFFDALYGVQKEVDKSIKLSNEILGYFGEAKSIAAEAGNKEVIGTIDNAIKQIEDFQLKSDEVGNLDNWLEGSGSNTADNGKFNQALSYDEWLKLIEADPVMQEYARSLNR